jgi:hypothetical protein
MTITDSLIFCAFVMIVFFGVIGITYAFDKREETEEILNDDQTGSTKSNP